jgi:phage terminase small subunit
MPILRNARHERFAQELAAGKTASEAYVLAGYKPNTGNAAALKGKQRISKRVDEILAKRERVEQEGLERAIERSAISKESVLEELAKIGFANMSDYMRVGPDGDPVLDFSALTRDQAAALVEVTVEDFKDGRWAYSWTDMSIVVTPVVQPPSPLRSATGSRRSSSRSSGGRCSSSKRRSLQPRPSRSGKTHSGPGTPWIRPIDAFYTGFVEFQRPRHA